MDWKAFSERAKASDVTEDTLEVLEAEGFDDKASALLKISLIGLQALRLDPGQAEKTIAVINSFRKTKAPASDTKEGKGASEVKLGGVGPKSAEVESRKTAAIQHVQKLGGQLLANIGTAITFVLSAPEQKGEAKREAADKALKSVYPDLQKLADAVNALPKEFNSVKQGAAQVVQTSQALMQVVGAVAGHASLNEGSRQTLNMVFERFEGAVAFLKLACVGKLTDKSTTKLLAAAAKGVEDRLLDVVNACKQYKANSTVMSGDRKEWEQVSQSTWVAVRGVLETLKHLGRMILSDGPKQQLRDALNGATEVIKTLLKKGKALDERAFEVSGLKANASQIEKDLETLDMSILVAEPERAAGPPSAFKVRKNSRLALSKSLFLASACSNVVLALPELKELGSRVSVARAALPGFHKLLCEAVKEVGSAPAHTKLLRKADELAKIVDKLADEASAAVPKVKRIGDTTNLEKRIKDAKGSFGAVKPPPSIGK